MDFFRYCSIPRFFASILLVPFLFQSLGGTFSVYADGDTTPPVVTIIGSDSMDTPFGSPFSDPGATWTDDTDGSGTLITANSGSVDTNILGSYLLEYSYTDIAGNPSNSASRTVNVTDQDPPVITLSGADPFLLEVGTPFIDPGATCLDNVDGTCTVLSTGSVDHTQTGTYYILYDATDTAGNSAIQVMRTVHVNEVPPPPPTLDTTPPVITLGGSGTLTLEASTGSYTDAGAEWSDTDNASGSFLSGSTLTMSGTEGQPGSFTLSGSVDLLIPGVYTLTYTKIDTSNNSTQATRTITVVDTTAPTLTLSGSNPITLTQGDTFTDPGAFWEDIVDGTGNTLTNSGTVGQPGSFTLSGEVNTSVVGTSTLIYTKIDQNNNSTQVTRTVNVIPAPDTISPIITLSGSSIITLYIGSVFFDPGSYWTDNIDGSGVLSTSSSGVVNTSILGSYTLVYRYTDNAGNMSNTLTRTVNVITQPIISLPVNGPGGGGGGSRSSSSSYAVFMPVFDLAYFIPRPIFVSTGTLLMPSIITSTGTLSLQNTPRIPHFVISKSFARITVNSTPLYRMKSLQSSLLESLQVGQRVRVRYKDIHGWALITTGEGIWGFVRTNTLSDS